MRVTTINNLTSFVGLSVSSQVMKKIQKSPKDQKNNALKQIEITDAVLSKISEDVCVFKPTKKNNVYIRAKESRFHPQKEIKVRTKNFIKNPSKYVFGLLAK